MQRGPDSISSAIVVGGGLIGATSALALARAGVTCVLVDPDARPTGASFGNAGHIATEQVEPLASWATLRSLPRRLFLRGGPVSLPLRDATAWLPFAIRLLAAAAPRRFEAGKAALAPLLGSALPAWRRLLDGIDARDLLREDGHFVVWESAATAARGRAAWAAADTGPARFRDATEAELARLASVLRSPPAGAIRFSGTAGIVDLPTLAEAVNGAFAALGGERRLGRIVAIDPAGAVQLADGTRLAADVVLIAAGAHSADLLSPLVRPIPLIAERGYHIQAPDADWPTDLPPLVFEDRALVVTGFRSGLRATSFVEFGRAASPPDPRKWARLRAHAEALGLPFTGGASEWMGARPTLPDYLPAIGRVSQAPRLFYAFGHQHLGLTLAATTAEIVAAMMTGGTPPVPLAPYDLGRFR